MNFRKNVMAIFIKVLFSVFFILLSLSKAQATDWKCSTKDGTRKFPIIYDVWSQNGGTMYDSILRALKISDWEYKSLAVECAEYKLKAKTQATEDVNKKTNNNKNNNSTASTPEKKIAKPANQVTSAKPVSQLNTNGLSYAGDLTSIYVGDFESVAFGKNSADMVILVNGYLNAFSERCNAALPKNKVELTKNVCDREEWEENGYGEIPGTRRCASSHREGTGVYADPELNSLNNSLYNAKFAGAKNLFDFLTSRNPTGDLLDIADKEEKFKKTMTQLLATNGCSSRAIKLFQANLIRFGQGSEAITSPGLEHIKATLSEYKKELLTFGRVLWCGRNCDNNIPLFDMLKTTEQLNGPTVLVCDYFLENGNYFQYGFWYKAPPINIQALLAEDKKGNTLLAENRLDNAGRLRWLGTQSVQRCPETKQKAKELRRAALIETGYPDGPYY